MRDEEIRRYDRLNELAEKKGIVIFECSADREIPLNELKQAFCIGQKVYNRSFDNLSVKDAIELYWKSVASISPEAVFLHIGDGDKEDIEHEAEVFTHKYCDLIAFIKMKTPGCCIMVVSLQDDHNPKTDEVNKHLKRIADSEECEYFDIAGENVWNPKAMMENRSILFSLGIGTTGMKDWQRYDLAKYCFAMNHDERSGEI